MPQIRIKNFNKSTIQSLETNNPEFYHQLIFGFVPISRGGLNVNNGTMSPTNMDSNYPLFCNPKKSNAVSLGTTYGKIISYTYPLTQNDKGDVYVITSKNYVLGINKTGLVTNYGQPFVPASENVGVDIVSFAGKIVASHPLSGSFYYKNEDNTGLWTAFNNAGAGRGLGVFAGWLLGVSSDSEIQPARYIQIYNSSFVEQTPKFDIGSGYRIIDVRSLDDIYVAIIVENKGGTKNYVYFWDGTPGTSYITRREIPGRYAGFASANNNHYILSLGNNALIISQIVGYTLNVVKTISGIVSTAGDGSGFVYKQTAASIENYIVRGIQIADNNFKYSLLWIDFLRDEQFLMPVGDLTSGNIDFFYGIIVPRSTYLILARDAETEFKYFNIPSSYVSPDTIPFDVADYVSNWIIPSEGGRILLEKAEVVYDYKPDNTTGTISITLAYKDDYLEGGGRDYTTMTLGTITNSSLANKTTFYIGKECSKFKIIGRIIHSGTNNWSGALKEIIIHYKPIRGQ